MSETESSLPRPCGCHADHTVTHHEELVRGFTNVINRASVENDTDTPDFILAELLVDCLRSFGLAAGRLEHRQSALSPEQMKEMLSGVQVALLKACASRAWWYRPAGTDDALVEHHFAESVGDQQTRPLTRRAE